MKGYSFQNGGKLSLVAHPQGGDAIQLKDRIFEVLGYLNYSNHVSVIPGDIPIFQRRTPDGRNLVVPYNELSKWISDSPKRGDRVIARMWDRTDYAPSSVKGSIFISSPIESIF